MGIAAASAAVMAATQPDVLADRARSRSARMGATLLHAAALQAAGDHHGAAQALTRCSELMHDDSPIKGEPRTATQPGLPPAKPG